MISIAQYKHLTADRLIDRVHARQTRFNYRQQWAIDKNSRESVRDLVLRARRRMVYWKRALPGRDPRPLRSFSGRYQQSRVWAAVVSPSGKVSVCKDVRDTIYPVDIWDEDLCE